MGAMVRKVARLGVRVLALAIGVAVVSGTPVALVAAEPAPTSAGTVEVRRADVARLQITWDRARHDLEETRNRYEALEHRIAALKRLRTKAPGADVELADLLRASLSADEDLRSKDRAVEVSRNQLEGRARET